MMIPFGLLAAMCGNQTIDKDRLTLTATDPVAVKLMAKGWELRVCIVSGLNRSWPEERLVLVKEDNFPRRCP